MVVVEFISTLAAVLVIPAIIFSFWRITQRDEYTALRDSGQKLNLNTYNLRLGFKRKEDDPLREAHIKLAKIGFLHWLLIPVAFFLVFILTMLAILIIGDT
ncbi:hypothetical protein RA20_00625 [Leisingera sp. ANG-Vp]|nr:hypothetical protein RA20_00625 [Leisingera sp. ANG-Vp]